MAVRVAGMVVALLVALLGATRAAVTPIPGGCRSSPIEGVIFGFDFTPQDGFGTAATEAFENYCTDEAEARLARNAIQIALGIGAAELIRHRARVPLDAADDGDDPGPG